MGVYDRNKGVAGTKPNWWISFTITEDQRAQHRLNSRTVRESGGDNQRAARALLALRRREVALDTWAPKSEGVRTLNDYAAAWLVSRELAGVKSLRNERQRLRDYVLPVLGDKPLDAIRRSDVRDLIADFSRSTLETTGKPPAPRMVHRVYEDLRTMLAQAVEVDEILQASPCTLRVRRGELPKKKDSDPRWRSGAIFDRDEVEGLIGDERIPLPRRVTYALLFLTGARVGEVVGLRWKDYEPKMRPLGRLVVATQKDDERTKTGDTREVPVHPVLASMLDGWRATGFELWTCRKPDREDFLVPRLRTTGRKDATRMHQTPRRIWLNLQGDLALLGFRRRRTHDSRRTLVSLAQADGARKDILHWITHGPESGSIMDLYSTLPWATFCEQIACLRIELPGDNLSARVGKPR